MAVVKDPDNQLAQIFTRLVEEHQQKLLCISYIYLKDRTLAEDAVQETFIKVYKALPQFRGECSEKTWVTRILINTCRDMNRSSWFTYMNRSLQPEDLPDQAVPGASEANDRLSDALWQLPARQKEVILLYYYHNMTMPEIAQALHVSPATVSRRIKNACQRLEDTLRKEGTSWTKSK
ncbi:MAG: sigma-70 family RNA polymerase sigma factor [Clostridia bacterium]|nr:sigma-70 family RNA polymerase sigma factor [Clostridia bacterium]